MKKNHSAQNILKRTAKLEKELAAKKRELEIEAALDKVRARTMAMKKSEELQETTLVLFKQLKELGTPTAQVSICIFDEEVKMGEMFVTLRGKKIARSFPMELDKEVFVMQKARKAFLKKEKNFSCTIKGKELQKYNHWRNLLTGRKGWDESEGARKKSWHVDAVFFSRGMMGISSDSPASDEAVKLLKRFSNVFDLTYTRFLDLQKAEAQAREAQIEEALERVRAKTMTMHKSEDLSEVALALFREVKSFGGNVGTCGFVLCDRNKTDDEYWVCWETGVQPPMLIPHTADPTCINLYKGWEGGAEFYAEEKTGDELKAHFDYMLTVPTARHVFEKWLRLEGRFPAFQRWHAAYFKQGFVFVITVGPYPEQEIFKRFAPVFGQAYTRFLDLQRAEAQAREAQIEASLERVRAKTMAMHNSQDVGETVITLLGEFVRLGIETFRCGIGIIHPTKEMEVWTARPNDVEKPEWFTGRLDMTVHALLQGAYSSWENKEKSYSYDLKGDDLVDYFTRINNLPNYSLKYNIPSLPPRLVHSEFYFPEGAVFVFSREPLSAESSQIFQRFAAVFRQTYRRFLDLQKAEAQAREGQIQLALERVRSRAMAMQSSDELKALIGTVFTELTKLDLVLTRCIIWVFEPTTNGARWWMANGEEPSNPLSFYLKYHEHPAYLTFVNGWKEQNVKFIYDLKGQDKINWDDILFNETELKHLPDVVKDGMRAPERVLLSASFNNFGGINAASLEPLSDEQFEILLRFAKVFDLTYTRFLDLQKAEAQAREAQIQLALERVRARTMAMQKSDELPQAANLLFQQVQSLGMPAWSAGYCIWDEDKQGITLWMSTEGTLQPPFRASLTEDPSFIHMREADERGESFFVEEIGGEDLVKHYQYMRTLPEVGAIIDSVIESGHPLPTFQIFHLSYFTYGFLLFITYEPVPKAHDIFKRIGKVFDQTYTRFLDLQKAEAQAREAEIQLALERVRARTMAMQHSDELKTAATLLFQQAKALGVPAYSCGYNIWEENENVFTSWMSTQDGNDINAVLDIPLTEDANFIRFAESRRKGEQFFVLELRGERMEEHYQYLKTIPAFRAYFDYAIKAGFPLPETQIHHIANFSHGNLLFITLQPCPEFHDVFKRFASVFDQTYTRFLDLQKAEAQARESQIEASLERVRSKTMAMHNSNDVGETVATMFAEFVHLGITTNRCGILIFNDEYSAEVWTARSTGEGKYKLIIGKLDLEMHQMLGSLGKAWKAKETFYQYELAGDDLIRYYIAINNAKFYPTQFDLNALPPKEFHTDFFFTDGAVFSFTNEPVAEEQAKIMKRFASVFGQTYRRYLDLQKAEAQAREAKIEAALEKVRSRTMGMQKSEELKEVIQLVYGQFAHLNIHVEHTGFILDYKTRDDLHIWLADQHLVPSEVVIPWFDSPPNNSIKEAKEKGEDFFTYLLAFEEKNKFYRELFKLIPDVPEETLEYYFNCAGLAGSGVLLENVGLYIENFSGTAYSDEENATLMRFGKVFQQTYTRFLDLQRAEAQARESQIQLALERARAQSMMMQHSTELDDTLRVFHEQVLQLKIPSAFSFLWLPNEEEDRHIFWASWVEDNSFKSKAVNYPLDRNEPATAQCLVDWKSNEQVVSYHVPPEAVANYFAAWSELIAGVDELQPQYFDDGLYYVEAFMKYGCFGVMVKHSLNEDEKKILERFAVEFERAYTRFLDLQKAEEQARESQIEAALERVRSRSLAMHHTSEIQEVIHAVHEELLKLNVSILGGSFIVINKDIDDKLYVWGSGGTADTTTKILVPDFNMRFCTNIITGIKKGPGFFTEEFSREEKIKYFTELFRHEPWSAISPEQQNAVLESKGKYTRSVSVSNHTSIFIINQNGRKFTEDENEILKRFSKVFEQAYVRFLDLQKAEAQSRESQIQLALERVRARTMAMQKSDELAEVIMVVSDQLHQLQIRFSNVSFAAKNQEYDLRFWLAASGEQRPFEFRVPYLDNPMVNRFKEAVQNNIEFYADILGRDEIHTWLKHVIEHTEIAKAPEEIKNFLLSRESFARSQAITKNIAFSLGNYDGIPFTDEENSILKRFANVFDQSYTRFLDLQTAEAQAREAQIEAALEKVRSRTMAMQKSEELSETVYVLFQQFRELGEHPDQATIGVINENEKVIEYWVTLYGQPINKVFKFPIDEPNVTKKIYKAWKENKKSLVIDLSGKALTDFMAFRASKGGAAVNPDEKRRIINVAFFSKGLLNVQSNEERSEESIKLLERFASVFEQTYTRFLDLERVEVQAREATIEAALERVRAKAMAMHDSNDLSSAASMVFTELRKLGISPLRCGVGLLNKESRRAQLYSATSSESGDSLSLVGWVMLSGHPVLEAIYDTWMMNEDYFPVLVGEQLKLYYEKLLEGLNLPAVPDWQSGQKQYGHFFPFSIGCLYAWSDRHYDDAEIKILKRFASIIDLTFRRYLELQKSEANAREAVKQAALDRVRADIASMRSVADLDRITPLIWNELTILGVPFIRCGVFILDDSQELLHTFLSTPDGKAIAAFHIPYDTPGNIRYVVRHWHNKSDYIDHWDESAFTEFAATLVRQGALTSPEQYLKTIPHGGFYLHFLPFLQGMLYVGNTDRLAEDEIKLIQSIADAFSTAYARYEDFNRLEAAKQQVEKTLADLKQAQTQLVQSEKMASLGELTAGIAHEIQNPLNFVNNFSDVSNELLEEMKSELEQGNKEDAIAIVEDVRKNLEKILYHGKRADAIVKGMLQHSRTSSGQKETMDINGLTDEYLRLAYHGLRAKDKSFNAKFETHFDQSLGKINIIPQDIGRVLLNLINNAFYAVTEKRKQNIAGYEPTVTITTGRENGNIEIKISDNGNGIPQKIRDKIFQPFFTTKPTGQGTGLGLSLAYDIVKAHGGEITVDTKEGMGSEFMIVLPQ